jgi:hypothetical protein
LVKYYIFYHVVMYPPLIFKKYANPDSLKL